MAESNRNFDVTNKIFTVLNEVKGFDVAMSNPRAGKIIIKYGGTSFELSVSPIFRETPEGIQAESLPFDQIVSQHQWIFRS